MEVYVDLVSHPTQAATVQGFRHAMSGRIVNPNELMGMKLDSVFPDTMGRLIMVFKPQ